MAPPRSLFRAFVYASLLASAACGAGLQQSLVDKGGDGDGAGTDANAEGAVPVDHLPEAQACTSNAPAPRGLRRLTQVELGNTVADLLGATAPKPASVFTNDPASYGFKDMYANLSVRDNGAQAMMEFAEQCGAFASSNVAAVSSCSEPTDACRTAFVTTFGARAFRRPLAADEVTSYVALAKQMPDFASGAAAVVSGMLQSPYFLYRFELGAPQGSNFVLTPYEVASELSYLYTASMPDAPLLQAAGQNALQTPAQIAAQAARLMKLPRAKAAVDEFFLQWLQVADLGNLSRTEDPVALDAATKKDMQTEARMLVDEIVFTKNGTFADLLTADHTYLNQNLATFYGASGGGAGATFAAVPAATTRRSPGVLGLGGVIAAASQSTYASPTMRGRMVRMRVLCDSLRPPPPGIPALQNPQPNQTTRQRFEQHTGSPTCAACHTLMDPVGFTFGSYDAIGRLRPGNMENGQPVDTSGGVYNPTSKENTVLQNLTDLTQLLATDPQAEQCMARHWSMYAFGAVDWPQNSCTFDAVAQVAATNKYNLQQTLLGLAQVPSFTQRVMDK